MGTVDQGTCYLEGEKARECPTEQGRDIILKCNPMSLIFALVKKLWKNVCYWKAIFLVIRCHYTSQGKYKGRMIMNLDLKAVLPVFDILGLLANSCTTLDSSHLLSASIPSSIKFLSHRKL